MILQVLADAWELVNYADAMLLQFFHGADAGKQQELRRAESASAKHYFAARFRGFIAPLPVIAHTRRALAVEGDPGCLRVGDNGQIRPVHHRMQIGGRGRATFAILVAAPELGNLIKAGAFLFRSVEIIVATDLVFRASVDEGVADRPRAALVGDAQRPVAAVQIIGAALIAFGALEIGQNIVPRPAVAAKGGPIVVIVAVAPDVDHSVDRTRATECLAARLIAAAAVEPWLWHRFEGPVVDLRLSRKHRRHADRCSDENTLAFATSLDQADGDPGVLRKTSCER